jgi:hypothetical protein
MAVSVFYYLNFTLMNISFRFLIASVLTCSSLLIIGQIQSPGEPFDWSDKSISLLEIPTITTSALAMDEVRAQDAVTDQYKETPYRFGIAHEVSLNVLSEGQLTVLPNGDKIWRLGINCPKAKSINLNFSAYQIPEGGQVTIWNAERTEYLGVFNSKNNKAYNSLAVGLVYGDKIIVEYYQQARVTQLAQLTIGTIVHGYRPVVYDPQSVTKGPIGTSGSCNMNVNCPDGNDWQDEKRGVALYLFDGFVCTGSLINNTSQDCSPLFLTAAHCTSIATNMVFYFNHESASCAGTTGPINQTLSGATLLAVAQGGELSDYRLVELSSNVPNSYQPYYNGWDRTNSVAPMAVGIHHPSGDVKKISFDDDPVTKTNYLDETVNPNASHWRVEAWERNTTTEGGSSGSPLFDENQRIIGQLHGGFASCSSLTSDWYGGFSNSWSGMASFLDPLGTGLTALDGLEGCGSAATCDDGIQNQGETGVDCGGPNCAPCTCDDGIYITVNITFDNYPADISWTLSSDGNTIATGGGYGNAIPGSTFIQEICAPAGCYEFTVSDSFGDGLCCQWGNGSWSVLDPDNNVLAIENSTWTTTSIGNFCVETFNPCPGDLNGDLSVDIADFLIFNGSFGQACDGCPADLNGDGFVDIEDFLLFNSLFGSVCE